MTVSLTMDVTALITCLSSLVSVGLLLVFVTSNPDTTGLRRTWTVVMVIFINVGLALGWAFHV